LAIGGGEDMTPTNKKVDLKKIKFLRKRADFSLDEISKLLGYESPNGYYYLETGRSKFPAEALAKVADILGVQINELFFEDKIVKMAIEKPKEVS
jgi:transcriptional regulator with XRE-family HTH domain